MREWYDLEKLSSGNFREFLQEKINKTNPRRELTTKKWSAPIGWSSLNVNAWSAFGLSGRCFLALAGGNPKRCVA
jgi:hypothetical protein